MKGPGDLPRNIPVVVRRFAYLILVAVFAGVAALAVSGAFSTNPVRERPAATRLPQIADMQRPSPSLHCLFSDFTHASVVVGFDFAVALSKGSPPRFAERAQAVRDDPEVVFDAGQQPIWSYALDDGTPTITSPGGETRIVLYGFKPSLPDASWIEAGIRSNEFRNLDGKCLQAHFP